MSDSALAFLDAHGDAPFFLWLHYSDPHADYVEHPGFAFRPEGAPAPTGAERTSNEEYHRLHGRWQLGTERMQEVLRHYDSEIAFADHHVGRVLTRLRERELYRKTLIVFTSDHDLGRPQADRAVRPQGWDAALRSRCRPG